MRLDHLLSKEEEVEIVLLLSYQASKYPRKRSFLGRDYVAYNEKDICLGKQAFHTNLFFVALTLVTRIFLVAMRSGDTPVLIPNTMVKTLAADDTMLETAWESRWLPNQMGL